MLNKYLLNETISLEDRLLILASLAWFGLQSKALLLVLVGFFCLVDFFVVVVVFLQQLR